MADTSVTDMTKNPDPKSSSFTIPVRRRKIRSLSENPSSTSGTTVHDNISMANPDPDAADDRRKATRELQLRHLTMAAKLSGLTLVVGMWLLGFFARGDWPENTNVHPVTLPSRHYDAMQGHMKEDAPFLMAFYSAKCMACRRMRIPFLQAGLRLQGVVPCYSVSVVQPGIRELLDQYNIKAVPTVILVRGEGVRVQYTGRAEAHKIDEFVRSEIAKLGEEFPLVERSESESESDNGSDDGNSMK